MAGKRPRKANFSPAECQLILQCAEDNLEVRGKFSNNLTNKRKKEFGSPFVIALIVWEL